ncbi:unnamed protein product, partial [Oikopleura dioica]
WNQCGASRSWSHWRAKTSVRHLGKYRQRCK